MNGCAGRTVQYLSFAYHISLCVCYTLQLSPRTPLLSLAAERFIFKRVPVLILISRLMILFFCWFCIVEVFSCHTRIYR